MTAVSRHLRSLGLLLPACVALAAPAAELSAEERLQAVRQELVQAALQGATQVRSTAWIDATGALHESNSFRHGMQVRGVRVLAYERDAAGQPRAQVQWQGREDLVKTAAPAAPIVRPAPQTVSVAAGAKCVPDGRLKHVLGWSLAVQGRWSIDAIHLAQQAGQQLTQDWSQAAASAKAWRLLELPARPVASASATGAVAAYERLLTAAPARAMPGWIASVRLEPAPARAAASPDAPQPPVDADGLRVSLTVSAADAPAPFYQASAELALQALPRGWAPPQLAGASRDELQRLVQQWSHELGERLACQPVKVQVLQAQAQKVQINQGAIAGLRVGEEWLISDRHQVPQRVLEPGAASAMVLARVEQVDALHAELRVLAGPQDQVRPRWQAWPMPGP